MAITKLTLSADDQLIERAKRLAAENGTSLSSMVSRMLAAALRERDATTPVGPVTRAATGLITLPPDKSDRELLTEAIAERHGA